MTKLSDNKCISLLIAISALIIVLMLPLRNSIYSDDVAFSQSVRHFLQTGDLKVSEYTAASSISHILWGSLFAKVLGFSFSSLNISVIILLPVLLIGFYKLLRTIDIPSDKSIIFTLFFLSVPWIPFLTYTFMSDIPFLTLELWSLLLILKYLKKTNPISLALILILASLAFLTRQLGLALILGIFIVFLLDCKNYANRKKYVFLFLIPVITILYYLFWLSIPGNKTIPQHYYEEQSIKAIETFIPFTSHTLGERLSNFGLYVHRALNYASQAMGLLFPLIFVIISSNLKFLLRFCKKNIKIIAFSTASTVIIYSLDVVLFRRNYTVGFPLLVYEYESFLPIPWAHIWKFMVLFSIPIWAMLVSKSVANVLKMSRQALFLTIVFIIILFMSVSTYQDWDRYILPLLPFAFIFFAKSVNKLRINYIVALSVAFIVILDSVQLTKLRYDEVGLLYSLGNQLVSQGVEPSTIDLNRDQGWDIWFYYEEGIQKQIKDVGGDKEKIDFQLFPLPKKNVKYGIYTDRMIKYQDLNIDYSKATIIPFKSLFVSSKLTFLKNL